ncbi:RNA polymerase sigma-70 factor [Siphonobacter aquaeclarae]|uniref:RNA polymerase sigma-70 factor, ECF subfamily n=1 Tax=Siphonobacter aquaeclarae TaxID=563176 RepID=A0A1G9R3K5_9BACT|nr:RNA polymerase sigma-70 factor [Siphonobacter aquaeclarae]SDM17437.1 RNA polymerase sigma-70 factor, ECF subfamily [Siphonobacter aquaeclarae]
MQRPITRFRSGQEARTLELNPGVTAPRDPDEYLRALFESDPRRGCEELFRRFYGALCSHAVRFVYSREVAEDIVSEVFFQFWSDKVYLTVTTSFAAYLFRAVRNRSYNYVRWELARSRQSTDASLGLVVDYQPSPTEIVQFDELHRKIEQTIEQLTPQCKRVFLMSRFENKRYQEIADELNLNVKTVETHISKALATLRAALQEEWFWCLLLIASL